MFIWGWGERTLISTSCLTQKFRYIRDVNIKPKNYNAIKRKTSETNIFLDWLYKAITIKEKKYGKLGFINIYRLKENNHKT